ncbi:MAG: hypothetical protein ACP5EK_00195 [Thermoplasmatota archaeon]
MRHRLARRLFREFTTATKWEKLVLVIPFIVLFIDADIFYYAWSRHMVSLLLLSSFVLVFSVIEIFAALQEIREHIASARRCSDLEKRVIDAIGQFPVRPTVGQVIEKMLRDNPHDDVGRYDLYPVVCKALSNLFVEDGELKDHHLGD